jgi:tetratricopeptide (TPR) repeat protein
MNARYNALIQLLPENPKTYLARGMVRFKRAQVVESIEDFDRAEQLDPHLTPYLWQRGLSYYYVGRFEEGAKQFEIDLTVNSHDVEETLWRYLCIARYQGIETARNTLLEVRNDPRLFLRSIYDLYAGKCSIETVLQGEESDRGNFYRSLYIGLYHETIGNQVDAKYYLRQAVNEYKISDYMWNLAQVHLQLRNWQ